MAKIDRFATCLWFDGQGEAAARFYVKIFKNSKIIRVAKYGEAGKEIHGQKPGSVMVVDFMLDGHHFQALNGGPNFKFNEAVSIVVRCKDQKEVDYYWSKLSAGGDKKAQVCGWLKDKFGVSWQVVPTAMDTMFSDPKSAKYTRVMNAMMKMSKLDLPTLQRAYKG